MHYKIGDKVKLLKDERTLMMRDGKMIIKSIYRTCGHSGIGSDADEMLLEYGYTSFSTNSGKASCSLKTNEFTIKGMYKNRFICEYIDTQNREGRVEFHSNSITFINDNTDVITDTIDRFSNLLKKKINEHKRNKYW